VPRVELPQIVCVDNDVGPQDREGIECGQCDCAEIVMLSKESTAMQLQRIST
jgi:hypothetical protein